MANALVHRIRYDQFKSELRAAMSQRAYMPMQDLDTPYWNTYEKLVMWKLVNCKRIEGHGLPPVPFSAIERVEQLAAGHVDYFEKFALYCSEMVDTPPEDIKP